MVDANDVPNANAKARFFLELTCRCREDPFARIKVADRLGDRPTAAALFTDEKDPTGAFSDDRDDDANVMAGGRGSHEGKYITMMASEIQDS
jgi:hypothetical protein